MKKAKKLLALVVAVMLMMSLAACAGGTSGSATGSAAAAGEKQSSAADAGATTGESPADTREHIELSFWKVSGADNEGFGEDPIVRVIEEKFNIKLNTHGGDVDQAKLKLAGGDLDDMMMLWPEMEPQVLSGNHALALDDLLASHGKSFLEEHTAAMAFSKKYHSNDGDNTYFLPVRCGTKEPPDSTYPVVGPYFRWDYYAELGYPEMNSYDDYLNVLKQMQDAHPTTADGKKVYALSSWIDWGIWPYFFPIIVSEGAMNHTDWFMMQADGTMADPFADPDSPFWKSVEFFNKGYTMGLLDPDYFTQDYETYMTKVKGGQILTTWVSWAMGDANSFFNSNEETKNQGFGLPLAKAFPYYALSSRDAPILGWSEMIFLSSKGKYPERAMELLNYLTGEEGSLLVCRGVEGVQWDYIDGVPTYKPEIEALRSDPVNYTNQTGLGLYDILSGFSPVIQSNVDEYPYSFSAVQRVENLTEIEKQYAAHYDVTFPNEALKAWIEEGNSKDAFFNYSIQAAMLPVPDDLHAINVKAEQYASKELAKAVMAESTDVFQAVKQNIIDEINSYGYSESVTWMIENWAKAKAELDSVS